MIPYILIVIKIFDLFFSEQTIDSIQEKFKIQRVSLLRRICKSVGIQLLLKDYQLDSRNKQIFQEEDIVSLYPIVKNIHPRVCMIRN